MGKHVCLRFARDLGPWLISVTFPLMQAVMTEHVVVYQGDSEKEVDRFDPGISEATLWQEVVIDSARGRLLRSDGVRLTRDSTKLAQGVYRFHAAEAGEARAKPAQVLACHVTCSC